MLYFKNSNDLENIARVLAEYTTSSKITNLLNNLDLCSSPHLENSTKWKRLHAAFINSKNSLKSDEKIIKAIEWVLSPASFINKEPQLWEKAIFELNRILQFYGLKINNSGKVVYCSKPKNYSEAHQRYLSLTKKFESLNIHPSIQSLCRPEILSENYFHLIFESSKIAILKVQQISGLDIDGTRLINKCFDSKKPLIVLNTLKNNDEKSEYFGLKALLNLIVYFYRNPKAHKTKAYNPTAEDEAIEALIIISKAIRLLELCDRNTSL